MNPRRRGYPVLLLARELNLGGSERQLCEMARALDRERFEVHVGCFRPGGIRAREIHTDGIPLTEFPVRSFQSPSNVWSSVRALRRYVQQHGIRVVHAFDAPTSVFVAIAACLLRHTVVLTSQRSFRQMRAPAFRAGLRVCDRLSDGVVVNCEAIREHLVFDECVPRRYIHLCYNGVDARRFQRAAMTPLRDRLPPQALVVGTVCVFRPEKDLSTLLRAFALCQRSNPDLFLVLVGDGPERANLQRQVLDLNIESRCLWQPAIADVVPWLSLIDVFVLPSTFEAFSNALMEAMACECVCVASRVGGNPELVHHGETGLLFDKGDVGSLVEQLGRLLADPPLRQRLGQRAAALIGEKFTLQAAAARLGSIYEETMAAKGVQ